MPTQESGCCPVCDRQVPRLLAAGEGIAQEIYACPDDGMVGYGFMPITLEQWANGIAAHAA